MIQVNYLTVVIAAVAGVIVGFLWYGPLFGKFWLKLVGKDKADIKGSPLMFVVPMVGSLVEAYVLYHFIHYAGAYTLLNGAKTGLWAAVGFVAPTMLANYFFQGKPKDLYLLDLAYHTAVLMAMGAVIAYWY